MKNAGFVGWYRKISTPKFPPEPVPNSSGNYGFLSHDACPDDTCLNLPLLIKQPLHLHHCYDTHDNQSYPRLSHSAILSDLPLITMAPRCISWASAHRIWWEKELLLSFSVWLESVAGGVTRGRTDGGWVSWRRRIVLVHYYYRWYYLINITSL